MKRQISEGPLIEIESSLSSIEDIFKKGKIEDKNVSILESHFSEIKNSMKMFDEQQVVMNLLNSADVIFCTLSTAGSRPLRRMQQIDDLIIDEASAATEPELFIPLRAQPNRLLLVGDPKQLPATVQSPLAKEYGLAQSLQERLMYISKHEFTMLDVQYRMREEISKWPMATFYNGKVRNGENVTNVEYKVETPLLDGAPYLWVKVSGEEKKNTNKSTYNESEGEVIVTILLELMKRKSSSPKKWHSADRIRIITFYQAQVDYLKLLLRRYNLDDVMVSTVDSSQGSEADVVIISFVRGTSGHMGFLKDNRRLNVALTRAKFQLICVGNVHAVAGLHEKDGNMALRALANDAITRSALLEAPGPLPPPPNTSNRQQSRKAKRRK
mmetsp:Transcript_12780/g.18799  ORF Transcript_12780/g.18799 Transcript_12780/m.18799 type:complete len:384 (-) Transcript_12780:167-1318(-)|eukprot:CAMPEP_0194204740 /NCGR_PEP_ID=MMETSP0156-20130528/4185_1 /TAXON_ID=33649 /ORGANISM="Thalassionema nitzschioides, Strain L26-B" /LENGTH=383 /DNA_ID=CAMNT_0038930833 /DNA_START=1709 /DNA_END=2860 /DNA_ORIENTATION=-